MFQNRATRRCLLHLVLVGGASSSFAEDYHLVGAIRDFKRGDQVGGHPDFQTQGGIDPGIVEDQIGEDGNPVYAGDPTTSTTTGQENFDQWYRDDGTGVNQRINYAILMNDVGGAYRFEDSTFFPIDGQLFGNEGQSNNFNFTYEIHAKFTYTSEFDFVDVVSDDDMWVFIDGQLVMDLVR